LAERVDLQVLTRESNRAAIERVIADLQMGDPLKSVTFHYHDLSKPCLWAKRHGLPTLAYYALWQCSVARRFRKLADEADVVHHLTFCTLLCPGFWKLKNAVFVLGPVGAPQVNPHYYTLFGGKAWVQKLRGWIMERFLALPWLRRLLESAAAIVPANSETQDFLIAHGVPASEIMLDTGTPDIQETATHGSKAGEIRLMYAGQLERRKGLELALRALALALQDGDSKCIFDIFGKGPDRKRLTALAGELGIADKVIFHGAVPQAELMRNFQQADAFIFTSVRDTSGGVNLEAMANGLPIICIAHQGVGDITDHSCALRVPPAPVSETVRALADSIKTLANSPEKRIKMGAAAKKRAALDFSWDDKFNKMVQIYRVAYSR
jgi:glycosyltransferase involved in cell wall biosynthesis